MAGKPDEFLTDFHYHEEWRPPSVGSNTAGGYNQEAQAGMKAEIEKVWASGQVLGREHEAIDEGPGEGPGEGSVTEVRASSTGAVRSNPRRLRRLLIASDVLAIVIGVVAATGIQQAVNPVPRAILVDEMLLGVVIVPIWILMMGANQLFLARAIGRFG